MIPLLDAPLSTVSKGYARDLVSHPVQTVHFADHLQEVFQRQGVVGVDNGLFFTVTEPPFSEPAIDQAKRGRTELILAEKREKRRHLLKHFHTYLPDTAWGRLDDGEGGGLEGLSERVPIFMMFGRMDPAQKGFDVLARAVEKTERRAAKFVFALEAAGGVQPFVDDLRRLAEDRKGDVVFISDRMVAGYLETMAGVSYCVMPSLHEPFGAATEPYLKGTPVVAHATGGLQQQVRSFREYPDASTGFLYRADCSGPVREQLGRYWDELLDCTDPLRRRENPLYLSMVDALADALRTATDVYARQPDCYGKMLANLYDQAKQFSWAEAADEYAALYDVATR
jgi:glycogen synthase